MSDHPEPHQECEPIFGMTRLCSVTDLHMFGPLKIQEDNMFAYRFCVRCGMYRMMMGAPADTNWDEVPV